MIEYSCADFTFPVLGHEQALKLIKLMGFDWVDIGLFTDRSHIQPEDQLDEPAKKGAMLSHLAGEIGLGISDVFLQSALDCNDRAINHPDTKIRQEEREKFKRLVEYTLAAGCEHITCLPGVHTGTPDCNDICAEELSFRCEYARKFGITYSIEPHLGSIMSTPKDALYMLERCEDLTLTLDHSHYISQGFSTDDVTPLVKYAKHFHVRGASNGNMQTSVKESTTDFPKALRGLKETNYAGKICFEYCWLEWENCNRTDNVSETLLLRELIEKAL